MPELEKIDSKINYLTKSSLPHEDTIFSIIPFAKVTQEMVDSACETSMDTLRHTTSGEDLVILKWEKTVWKYTSKIPTVLTPYSEDPTFKVYTYDEILVELKKPEWQSEDPEEVTTTKTTTKSVLEVG